MRIFIATVSVFLLASCSSAQLVRMQADAPKGGVIKLKTGVNGSYNARREAIEIMADFCFPDAYNVTGRGKTSDPKAMVSLSLRDETKNTYVFFQCSPRKEEGL